MNMMPADYQSDGHSTPVLIYPYERTRAALDSMAKAGKPHPAHGFRLRYANPATGKHPFPTMAVVDAAAAGGICRQDLSLDRQRGVRGASRPRAA